MTIVEFLHPLRDAPLRHVCLAAMYFEIRYSGRASLTVAHLRQALRRARFPRASKLNLSDVLGKAAPYVATAGQEGYRFLWALTPTGEQYVRDRMGLPKARVEIEQDVSTLEALAKGIASPEVAGYLAESVRCLSVGALRASVVFLWVGAVREIQTRVIGCGTTAVNAAIGKYDPRGRAVKKIDDLSCLKESTLLLVSQELGVFDKNERTVLEAALDLRNKCGHPGKYSPGPKKASSFIEDVAGIVFA